MRVPFIALLSLVACNPVGEVYSVRSAELQLVLPCDDTASCEDLFIFDVPFEREEQADFEIFNAGERALLVEVLLEHPDFTVSPDTTNVAASGSASFSVSYAPSGIDDQQADLSISHNAGGPPLELAITGTTDADADADGFHHTLAPSGDDCNDFNAQVNPGVEETWYDGIDQNCDDASDYDQDGDDHDIHTRPDGDDCNDEDPRVHPGAPDNIGDEIDQNCDGEDG